MVNAKGQWEVVIGLEIHVQLATQTKLFASESNQFGEYPNINVGPVCAGLPGSLPVLNENAIDLAILSGLAFNCDLQRNSEFARKHYFYPDLPKGYQISQFAHPLFLGGRIKFRTADGMKSCQLTRIHVEEDAGKTIHDRSRSRVDLNRAGVPLIEIVTEPVLNSASDAVACLREIRRTLRAIGTTDGNMEQGSLRCDANVSIRLQGNKELGTRAEIKNINSFRFLKSAIEFEIERQIHLLESGKKVVQETRLYDEKRDVTRSMRSKEEADDYRYMPDPDLPSVIVSEAREERLRSQLPEMPLEREIRYLDSGISSADVDLIMRNAVLFKFFDEVVISDSTDVKKSTLFIVNSILPKSTQPDYSDIPENLDTKAVKLILNLLVKTEISNSQASEAIGKLWGNGGDAESVLDELTASQVSPSELKKKIKEITIKFPNETEQVRTGNQGVLGFLTGQVMKDFQGRADGKVVRRLLLDQILNHL